MLRSNLHFTEAYRLAPFKFVGTRRCQEVSHCTTHFPHGPRTLLCHECCAGCAALRTALTTLPTVLQESYRRWVCSSLVPHFPRPGGPRVRPCRSVCRSVEQKCPFFLPGDRAPAFPTQYAGEPTFLCVGEYSQLALPLARCDSR